MIKCFSRSTLHFHISIQFKISLLVRPLEHLENKKLSGMSLIPSEMFLVGLESF